MSSYLQKLKSRKKKEKSLNKYTVNDNRDNKNGGKHKTNDKNDTNFKITNNRDDRSSDNGDSRQVLSDNSFRHVIEDDGDDGCGVERVVRFWRMDKGSESFRKNDENGERSGDSDDGGGGGRSEDKDDGDNKDSTDGGGNDDDGSGRDGVSSDGGDVKGSDSDGGGPNDEKVGRNGVNSKSGRGLRGLNKNGRPVTACNRSNKGDMGGSNENDEEDDGGFYDGEDKSLVKQKALDNFEKNICVTESKTTKLPTIITTNSTNSASIVLPASSSSTTEPPSSYSSSPPNTINISSCNVYLNTSPHHHPFINEPSINLPPIHTSDQTTSQNQPSNPPPTNKLTQSTSPSHFNSPTNQQPSDVIELIPNESSSNLLTVSINPSKHPSPRHSPSIWRPVRPAYGVDHGWWEGRKNG